MTILEDTRVITGGVDTHAGMHVAAALDPLGGLLGVREFPATAAGYADLLSWLTGFGDLALAGVEAPAATAPGWPGTWPRPACGSWRSTAQTGRTGTGRANPIRWTPSAQPGPPSPAGRAGRPRAGTARWRRSGR